MDIKVGDKITLKKKHPCGNFDWEVFRVGADFKIKCAGCGVMFIIPREKIEKSIKKINGLSIK